MSNQIFPTLRGLTWDITKVPDFKTTIQKSVSGRELRVAYMQYPLYTFSLSYSVLKDNATPATPSLNSDFQTLLSFFLARSGTFDNFLYLDPSDNLATNQTIGIGNGTNRMFNLVRSYGNNGIVELVQNPNAITITVNGVVNTQWTQIKGLITFNTAPINGAVIKWSGSFYYRVRFMQDNLQFNQFAYNFWELKKVDLYGSLANKI
jgi:uncharacterized protein (TIGR02217 family)